ncbi:ThiF family adenylyltransferase [Sporosarcina sp. 179-K 3D1 HS]|uniref:ThiF family adenylyltransferase n=1 Tax=Sporosarcina sp. 179-K 3D1 HS TaxID=3232169 RepID=UPI0039A00CD7
MNGKYSRQELFAPIGEEGQRKIRNAKVFVMGAGALGSSSAEMLVRAGVGELTIVDRDIIEWTNLHRQQLYAEQDVVDQLPKAVAAKKRLTAINGDVRVTGIVADVTPENVEELITGHDLVIDGTDNIEIRLLMNDAAMKKGIPFFMGACVGSYGLSFPIGLEDSQPCLHCLLDTLPSQMMTCDTVGVISPIVVTTAARQVADVLKYLSGATSAPKLESADLWSGERSTIDVQALKKTDCPSCSDVRTYPFLDKRSTIRTAVLCGRDTVQLTYPASRQFELQAITESIEGAVTNLKRNPHLAVCQFSGHRIVLFRDGRILIHGTKDISAAKRIMASLLG